MTDYEKGRAAAIAECRSIANEWTRCSCWNCSDECAHKREGAERVRDSFDGLAALPPTHVVVPRETLEKVMAGLLVNVGPTEEVDPATGEDTGRQIPFCSECGEIPHTDACLVGLAIAALDALERP